MTDLTEAAEVNAEAAERGQQLRDDLYFVRVVSMKLPSVANLREHWGTRKRRVKAQRTATAMALLSAQTSDRIWQVRARLKRGEKLHVKLLRIAPRFLDTDNLAGALKAVRDEVAKQLGVSDSPDSPVTFGVGQTKPLRPKATPGVMILIGGAVTP